MGQSQSFGEMALSATIEAAGVLSLSTRELEIIRLGERAVMRLDGGRVIARVERSSPGAEAARHEVRLVRWLDSAGLPVARPLAIAQPVVANAAAVTFWHAVDGGPANTAALGVLLKHLHRLRPPAELLPISLVHGDASTKNTLTAPDGPVLIDFEFAGWGQPEWDLTQVAVLRGLGWHTDQEYREFCDAYGFDITTWHGYPTLRAVRELRITTFLTQLAGENLMIDRELHHRVADLMIPGSVRRWGPET
jgi:aminoglycoside phosphotransferase (APT) family kinase protein